MPRCGVCNCFVRPEDETLHLQSKRHDKHVTVLRERIDRCRRSVYVKYVTPAMTEDDIKQAFETHTGMTVEHVDIDPRKHNFAMVRFTDEASAQTALSKSKRFKIGKAQVHYIPRALPEGAAALAEIDANGGRLPDTGERASTPVSAAATAASEGGETHSLAAEDSMSSPPVSSRSTPTGNRASKPQPGKADDSMDSNTKGSGSKGPSGTSNNPTPASGSRPTDKRPKSNISVSADEKLLKKKHVKAVVWDDIAGIDRAYRPLSEEQAEENGRTILNMVDAFRGPAAALTEHQLALDGAKTALQRWLKQLYPDQSVQVQAVGSSANGLLRATSDLDVAVFISDTDPHAAAEALVPLLRDHAAVKQVVPVLSSRLAMISYTDIAHGDLHVDVTFDNSNAVKNTALVSEYLRICPGLSTLTMALSAWLTAEVQRWSSYTCIMMTLMYLQLKDEIPNLQTRMASCAACQAGAAALAPDDAGGPAAKKRKADAKPTAHDSQAPAAAAASAAVPGQWDYRYCTHAEPVGSDRAAVGSPALASWLGKHLPEMLVYYANEFQAGKQAVSARQGKPLTLKKVHPGMWLKSGIVVEDPFELSHNIASKVLPDAWRVFCIAARSYLAHVRHAVGVRRVTKVFTDGAKALNADGKQAAIELKATWQSLEAVTSPTDAISVSRWSFAGDSAAWMHKRQQRRAQQRLAKAEADGGSTAEQDVEMVQDHTSDGGRLIVHLLYPAVGKRLVTELVEGTTVAFQAWLLNFVPRVSDMDKKED